MFPPPRQEYRKCKETSANAALFVVLWVKRQTSRGNFDERYPSWSQKRGIAAERRAPGRTGLYPMFEINWGMVKEEVWHILGKIGVADRTQAAVWAARNGLG
jgi:hypothetical protein